MPGQEGHEVEKKSSLKSSVGVEPPGVPECLWHFSYLPPQKKNQIVVKSLSEDGICPYDSGYYTLVKVITPVCAQSLKFN